METDSAMQLISNMIFKPGWRLECEDLGSRFEGAIKVTFWYPAYRSERSLAYEGYPEQITARASFALMCTVCDDDVTLARKVLDMIADIDSHEAREALRFRPNMWAPFHPHRADGMVRFGTPEHDLSFGLA